MGANLTDGMDTGRVKEVAGQLNTEAGRVGEISSNGTSQAGTLKENWLGPDSEQFGDAWGDAAKALQQAQDALQAYSKAAIQQADQQEKGSGA
ncbi:hypothetical protein [Janibacter indicus]|uniref:WXG100 family type VII secretion target n=2 Tax=Janibacter indicus TaxID=857417 RepID=A0A1W2AUM0_9MICO|nr:hypothetical protein [Janibacter indicus]SMC64202.1 hypothetical protein SAMN06296429_106207 [Janibacter indicus]